jgi:hypothetical protein
MRNLTEQERWGVYTQAVREHWPRVPVAATTRMPPSAGTVIQLHDNGVWKRISEMNGATRERVVEIVRDNPLKK